MLFQVFVVVPYMIACVVVSMGLVFAGMSDGEMIPVAECSDTIREAIGSILLITGLVVLSSSILVVAIAWGKVPQ